MAHSKLVSSGWRMRVGVLAAVGVALAGAARQATAEGGPSLGGARSFAVLGAESVSSTGLTVVTGDVGVSPGTGITGFPPGTVTRGSLHSNDAVAAVAHADAGIAYAFLAGMASIPANNLSGVDLGGLTLTPNVYKFDSSAQLTGALTLDAQGDSSALFVIQVASALTTASNAAVVVINGGANYDESRVFWQIGSSATLGSGTAFKGNILAYASITLVTGATLDGNALALNGAVTMESNTVTSPPIRGGNPNGRPTAGRTTLSPPDGAADLDAAARLDVKHVPANRSRAERSWFRMKVRHLDSSTEYTLWADDPSTLANDVVQFDSFTTAKSGNFNYTQDTKKGGTLPFGATLANLSGMVVEVRDAAGTTTLLEGLVPSTSP
jgi:hypothetical protein